MMVLVENVLLSAVLVSEWKSCKLQIYDSLNKSLGRDGERDSAERAWGSIEQLPFFQHGDGDKDVAENRI